ncbi:MAG: hypothetical protein HFH41_03025 [Lachnospiraceae bacterium]|nr:hypothetical protein [Lachnospiraceae bacterium]
MGQDLILIGSGGCMREILWQIEERNKEIFTWNILGYVDKQPFVSNGSSAINVGDICCPYLGDDNFLLSRHQKTNVAVSVGEPELRKRIVEKLKKNHWLKFPNLIMSDTRICQDTEMGQGCIISMDCRISTNVILGDFVFLNIASVICHDGRIGDFTTLSPDTKIAGQVRIGSQCEIGMGSKVIQGTAIGDRVTAGAGSVIVKDIQNDCKVAGVPARKIG